MRDYMKGLRSYVVTITAGVEHTGVTFTEMFVARNADDARESAAVKYQGACVGVARPERSCAGMRC